jgi:hypothetical protein
MGGSLPEAEARVCVLEVTQSDIKELNQIRREARPLIKKSDELPASLHLLHPQRLPTARPLPQQPWLARRSAARCVSRSIGTNASSNSLEEAFRYRRHLRWPLIEQFGSKDGRGPRSQLWQDGRVVFRD